MTAGITSGGTWPGAPEIDKLRAFYNHPGFIETLVDRAQVDLMMRPHLALPIVEGSDQRDAYGYGMEVRTVGGVLRVGKEGATDGVSAIIIGSNDYAAAWAVDDFGAPPA